MQPKEKHDIGHLEGRIKELSSSLTKLSSEQEFQEFIKNIHQPWWTTPAEFKLVSGMVESLLQQTKALANLKQALFEGSRAVKGSNA